MEQVGKMKEESQRQILEVKNKMVREIGYLQIQIQYKQEEIDKIKEAKFAEMEVAR